MKIEPNQHFKIQILYWNGFCRDEFTSQGPEEFKRYMIFAKAIANCYESAKIVVVVKSKHV